MKTRSADKKSFTSKEEITTPLPPKKRKIGDDQIPEAEIKSEINLGNGQPIFNIHVHVPPVTSDSNKSPVIHLHFGELVKRLSKGTSYVTESDEKSPKVKLPSPRINNCKNQSKELKKIVIKPVKKSTTYKKPGGNTFQKNIKNSETEKSEGYFKSNKKTEERTKRPGNELCQEQVPARRSVRLEHNRILAKTLEEIKESNRTVTNSISKKSFRNSKKNSKTDSSGNSSDLKEAVVVLEDILKTKKTVSHEEKDEIMSEKQEDFNCNTNEGSSDIDNLENVKEQSCNLSQGCDKEISEQREGNELDLEINSIEQNIDNISNQEEVYSISHSSENTVNTNNGITSFLNKCYKDLNSDNSGKSDSEKGLNSFLSDSSESYVEVSENSQVQESTLVMSEENECTDIEISNDEHHSIDIEKVRKLGNICVESQSKSVLGNCFEEKELVLGDNRVACVNSSNFQLNPIEQEMKKRRIQEETSSAKEKSRKKQTAKETTKTTSRLKKRKLQNQIKKSPSANLAEKVFPEEDFIPLQVSGPTKFAVAKINKIQPYNTHKAKNFKQEMLFRQSIKRHSNPKHLQIYRLKKEAAKKRKRV